MDFFEFFMALRYVKPKRSFISFLTMLSVLGPVVGVAVLITVIAVMSGFDHDIRERILNMHSHFTITRFSQPFRTPENDIAQIEKVEGLTASATIDGPVLLQTRRKVTPQMLIGIMPEHEKKVTKLYEKIVEGSYTLEDDDVLVGRQMAIRYGLTPGSKIVIHSLDKIGKNVDFTSSEVKMVKNPVFSLPKELTVSGVFELGMHEYDTGIMFTNLDTADEIFGQRWGSATSIKVKTPNPFDLKVYEEKLESMYPYYNVMSWQDSNRTLFGALQMEKNMMFFLLFFIVLVAAVGIAGTLLTFAMQKNREVGVMKALGATPGQIMRIFLYLGLMIGGVATTLGTVLGVLIVENRQTVAEWLSAIKGSDIFPPSLYHLNQIPGKLFTSDLLLIYFGSLLLCVLAAMIPAAFAAMSNPAQALKSEEML